MVVQLATVPRASESFGDDVFLDAFADHVNRGAAALVRQRLRAAGVFAVSLFGGPGCGKTLLLLETLKHMNGPLRCGVIVGNVRADRDAEMLRPWCGQVEAIETVNLTATLVREAIARLRLADLDLLFIERGAGANPHAQDLGQDAVVGIYSAVGGDDKVERWSDRVRGAQVVLLTKSDLLPFVDFDRQAFHVAVAKASPRARVIEVSTTGRREGVNEWCDWLRPHVDVRHKATTAWEVNTDMFLG